MLKIDANQFEFDNPHSEERVLLAVAGRHEFESVDQFLEACTECSVKSLRGMEAEASYTVGLAVSLQYIERLLGRRPPPEAATYRIRNDWNDIELVYVFGSTFLWYHWTTSA